MDNRFSASVFKFFIETQYQELKIKLISEEKFIEDVFHQSLLDVAEELNFDLEPTLGKSRQIFNEKYKNNLLKNNNEKQQYILFEQSLLEFIMSNNLK